MKIKLLVYSLSFLILGFAIGFTLNSFGFKRIMHNSFNRPPDNFNGFIEHFSNSYNLTKEQESLVSEVFKAQKQELDSLREEVVPKFDKIREKTHLKIKNILSKEQAAKFQVRHDEHIKRRKRHDRDGRRPPPHHGDGHRPPHPHHRPPHHGPEF